MSARMAEPRPPLPTPQGALVMRPGVAESQQDWAHRHLWQGLTGQRGRAQSPGGGVCAGGWRLQVVQMLRTKWAHDCDGFVLAGLGHSLHVLSPRGGMG